IGEYFNPKVRLPGSGGACEIATHAKRTLMVMRMSPKSFVETCDFVTSPGTKFVSKMESKDLGRHRKELKLEGAGPVCVITDLGVCEFRATHLGLEMTLTEIYEGVTIEEVKSKCGWDLAIAPNLKKVASPDAS